MIKTGLKFKIISGNLAITALMVIVGLIAVIQFITLGDLVAHLTGSVATEVKVAGNIRAEILNMRTSVENFISLNRTEDRESAEAHITNVNRLLEQARSQITDKQRSAKLQEIETAAREYIEKFNNVVIRMQARDDNTRALFAAGDKLKSDLHSLVLQNGRTVESFFQESEQMLTQHSAEKRPLSEVSDLLNRTNTTKTQSRKLLLSMEALGDFLDAKAGVNHFLLDYDTAASQQVSQAMNAVITRLETDPAFETVMYGAEDYLDAFEGLAAVSLKMNREIKDTLLPLAPRIVALAGEVTDSGWQEMNLSRQRVEEKKQTTQNVIIGIVLMSLIAGIGIGAFLARRISKPIARVVDGLSGCARQVADGAVHILSASQDLAQGASEQAASIEETSSSLEEMSAMTKQNADNATQADKLMQDCNQVVNHAEESMASLTASMQEISAASEETSKIIKTIDEISF
ncbi:MAG: hypothetical protein GY868_07245, partial [Deltaproteobacteria bacterium]|nr:hypothetical protein [Deltaproteobacteria bacterium]